MDYATGDPRLGGNPDVSSGGLVRGHEAARAADESSVSLVWAEREGVLAWVQVPVAMSNELSAIAEGLRTLDGPTTMPHLIVAGLGQAWDTYDNDADGVIYARVGGARCVGIGWVPDPCSTYVTRSSLDGSATIEIAGVGPSGAATARFGLEDGSSYDFELTDVDGIADAQLFYAELPAVGQTYSVTWLSADGSELAGEWLDFPSTAFDGDVVGVPSTERVNAADLPRIAPDDDQGGYSGRLAIERAEEVERLLPLPPGGRLEDWSTFNASLDSSTETFVDPASMVYDRIDCLWLEWLDGADHSSEATSHFIEFASARTDWPDITFQPEPYGALRAEQLRAARAGDVAMLRSMLELCQTGSSSPGSSVDLFLEQYR
jgi:hypothetical protein